MLNIIKNSLKSIFDFKGKTKLNIILDSLFLVFFFFTLVSIPMFSFRKEFTFVTWIFTIITFLIIFIELLLFYKLKVDIFAISLSFFLVSALISSAINKFESFVITPLFLNLVTIIVYLYLRSNKSIIKSTIACVYLALCVFVFVYLIRYGKDVFSFNTERLGNAFGDQNDIALFLSLCFVFSAFIILNSNYVFKIFASIVGIIAFLCGASTGSKVFLLTSAVTLIGIIIVSFGKKRWYLSLGAISFIVIAAIIMFEMPFMANLKNRVLVFISSFFDIGYTSSTGIDASSFDRYHLLKSSFELFLTKPLFGYGVNGFQNANGFYNGWSHNNLGEYLADFGLIGTLLFNLPILLSIFSYFIDKNKTEPKIKNLSFIIILFFICAMFSVYYTREKIYSFIIPISFAVLYPQKEVFSFSVDIKKFKILKEKEATYNE